MMNLSVEDMNSKTPSSSISQEKLDKIFVDLTEVTIVEGSVVIINVAVNPVRTVDTKIRLTLTSPTSKHIRFNPIPSQITIPAGMTSKSVTISSIDDSLVQDQEIWNFNIIPIDEGVAADPGNLIITLNDNDGGFIPNAPTTTPIPKILGEINPFPVGVTGISFQNKVVYKGADAANGYELWVSDGTSSGTYMLKDINPGINSSNPSSFFKSEDDSYVLFVATSPDEGTELWRTDGTPNGTYLLKDFIPGPLSNQISFKFTKGNKVFMIAVDPVNGSEVNISDGTISGTFVLKDIATGPADDFNAYDTEFVYFNNEIYFSFADASSNFKSGIWKTDGTTSGTVNITYGTSSGSNFINYSAPNNFKVINGKLVFSGYTAAYGYEMFVTDGTAAGTTLLKDFYTTTFANSYAGLTGDVFNSKASIAISYDDNTTSGIWITDGTPAGTTKISSPAIINQGITLGVVNEKLIFQGKNSTTGEIEPWVTDGTSVGTMMLKDINPGNDVFGNPKSSTPTFVANLGNKLIFSATSDSEGTELWITDGTQAGTTILSDIIPGSLSSYANSFKVVNNKLYFSAFHLSYGNELWVTDGTPSGTSLLKDIQPGTNSSGPIGLYNLGNTGLLFSAYNSAAQFGTLFYSDFSDVFPISHALVESNGSLTSFFSYYLGHVYFNAKDTSNGNPLWVTDGTTANTYKLVDIFPNSSCMNISSMVNVNGSLLFTASDDTHGKELWTTDGTANGTQLIKDIYSGNSDGFSTFLTTNSLFINNSGTKAYFAGTDANGTELWTTDGTNAGTYLIKDIYTGSTSGAPNSGSPGSITFVPGTDEFLFLGYKTSDSKRYVFRSDGTAAGTVEVTGFGTYSGYMFYQTNNTIVISVSDASKYRLYGYDKVAKTVSLLTTSYTTDIVNYNGTISYSSRLDKLFFATKTSDGKNHKVWVTDGTVAGTATIKTLTTASYNESVLYKISDDGTNVLFSYTISNATNKGEIWKTDGTAAGTTNVTNLPAYVFFQIANNGLSFFMTATTTEGSELWVTDGTALGTKLLKDIYAGSGNSDPGNYTIFNNQLYFTAKDIDHGIELWRTNGQPSGTELVYDINPGTESSSPGTLTPIGNTLYFKASKILSGSEIWTYTPAP